MAPLSNEASESPVRRPASGTRPGGTGSKRMEYVQQACITCRKRKVKCTGGETCAECSKAGESCLYTETRRKSRGHRNVNPQGQLGNSAATNGPTALELPGHLIHMNARLAELEAHCSQLKTFLASSRRNAQTAADRADPGDDSTATDHNPLVHGAHHPVQSFDPPQDSISVRVEDEEEEEHPLTLDLPHIPTHDIISYPTIPESSPNLAANAAGILESLARSVVPPTMPIPSRIDLSQAEQKVCLNNGAHFRPALDLFFRLINPLHPILNENQFRSQFDTFVFDRGKGLGDLERVQFLALVLLIYAEVNMLNGVSPDPETICGWDEFCNAEGILADIIWKETANLLTVQCLLIKTRYLTYLHRLHQARDTMAAVVRICLMIGLHDQSRWTVQGADPFDIVLRQRVFWSLCTLERSVSLSCGMPPTLRASDYLVNLPQSMDDRSLVPNRPLPGETPELSFIPYLRALVTWGELWGEIWESMFSVRAVLVASAELISSLDTKILTKLDEVPQHIKWKPGGEGCALGQEWVEPWVLRQRIMYITRMNALRLLIRQELMYKADFGCPVASDIVRISGENVRNMADYLRSAGHNIDRYFLSTYLSALIIPLSCVILKEGIPQALCEEAIGLWRQTIRLLDELSRSFGVARLLLKRFDGVVKMVSSVTTSQQTNGVGGLDQAGLAGYPVAAAGHDGDGTLMEDQIDVNGVRHASDNFFMEFSPMHFQGVASDPDLWRVTTW